MRLSSGGLAGDGLTIQAGRVKQAGAQTGQAWCKLSLNDGQARGLEVGLAAVSARKRGSSGEKLQLTQSFLWFFSAWESNADALLTANHQL